MVNCRSIAVQWSRDLPVWSLLQGSSVSLGPDLRDARLVHGHAFFPGLGSQPGHLSNPQTLGLDGEEKSGDSDDSRFCWSSYRVRSLLPLLTYTHAIPVDSTLVARFAVPGNLYWTTVGAEHRCAEVREYVCTHICTYI